MASPAGRHQQTDQPCINNLSNGFLGLTALRIRSRGALCDGRGNGPRERDSFFIRHVAW